MGWATWPSPRNWNFSYEGAPGTGFGACPRAREPSDGGMGLEADTESSDRPSSPVLGAVAPWLVVA